MNKMKISEFNEMLGTSIWKWNAIPGVIEIKMRTIDVGDKPKISFILMISPDFDSAEIYDEVNEHLSEDIKQIICLNVVTKYD